MGCAECHDHKFDPFLARDSYSLSAFFADVKQWGVYQDYNYTPNPDLRGWSNDHPFPPGIEVQNTALSQSQDTLAKQIAQLTEPLDSAQSTAFAAWKSDILTFLKNSPSGWATLASTGEASPAAVPKKNAKSKANPALKTTITFQPAKGSLAAIRIELLPDANEGGNILRGSAKSATFKPAFALQ